MKKKHTIIVLIIVLLILLIAGVALWISLKDKEPTSGPTDEIVKDDDVKEEEKEPEPTVVGQEKETIKGEITDFKYGVKQQPVTYNTYDVYSDGSKKLVESIDDILYFHEGYNATMDQLKAEGELAVTVYMDYYQEILELVNKERAAAGVAPLVLDEGLCHVASFRAAELEYSNKFSHERPDGSGCFNVTQFYKITYKHLAENIAQGFGSPKSVVKAWKKDATDYSYMLDARFTKLGVGHSDAGIHKEWVTVFSD